MQVLLLDNNSFPTFEILNKEYVKKSAEKKVEDLFGTSKFYIEQLYTWGDPKYYTEDDEIIITYLCVINKNNIKSIPKNMSFYDIRYYRVIMFRWGQ